MDSGCILKVTAAKLAVRLDVDVEESEASRLRFW